MEDVNKKFPEHFESFQEVEDVPKPIELQQATSRYIVPIVSNVIHVRGREARLLKLCYTCWDDLDQENLTDAVVIEEYPKPLKQISGLRSFETDDTATIPSEELKETYNLERSSSNFSDVSMDPSALPETLRLLASNVQVDQTPDSSEDNLVEDEPSTEFLELVEFSERFVEGILKEAKEFVDAKHQKKVKIASFFEFSKPHDIDWPPIRGFDVDTGVKSIVKYIEKNFTMKEKWMFKINLVVLEQTKVSDYYTYEVKFSLPTPSYPVAQVTASIFFFIEVSKVIPDGMPVTVTLKIETLRTIMKPGEVKIHEDVLFRVLYAKLMAFQQFKF